MKKKAILLFCSFAMVLSWTACGKTEAPGENDGDKGSGIIDMTDYYLDDNVEVTFKYADEFNKNSDLEVMLLSDELLDSDKCHIAGDEVISVTMYEGETDAYAFDYPQGTGKTCWTQIYVKSDCSDVLGLKVGDAEETIFSVMEKYGYQPVGEKEKNGIYPEADYSREYCKGDLHITFYTQGDNITLIHVAVYQQVNSKYADIEIMY